MAARFPEPAHDVVELLVGEAATLLSLPGLPFEVADLGLLCLLLLSHCVPLWLCQQSWRCWGRRPGGEHALPPQPSSTSCFRAASARFHGAVPRTVRTATKTFDRAPRPADRRTRRLGRRDGRSRRWQTHDTSSASSEGFASSGRTARSAPISCCGDRLTRRPEWPARSADATPRARATRPRLPAALAAPGRSCRA